MSKLKLYDQKSGGENFLRRLRSFSELIPVDQIYTPLGRSDCGCKTGNCLLYVNIFQLAVDRQY